MPRISHSALGLFIPLMRELGEMAYQWEEPFGVDDTLFRPRFGDLATPLDEAGAQTIAYAREMVGRKKAAA